MARTQPVTVFVWSLVLAFALAISHKGDPAAAETKFRQIPVQFIAALGDPEAGSGTGAQDWRLWREDPGPRGVRLANFERLQAANGIAPAKWVFDSKDWWLEEHGLIMEQPADSAPGKYLVTGNRETQAVLTIRPKAADNTQRWELDNNAKLIDVTHLRCRSARYTPATTGSSCSPATVQQSSFPVAPGGAMPPVDGCNKQDHAVLFVIAIAEEN